MTASQAMREALERGRSQVLYDQRGRTILTRAEWEQFPRWRRWRDLLLGWEPVKLNPKPYPWEQDRER